MPVPRQIFPFGFVFAFAINSSHLHQRFQYRVALFLCWDETTRNETKQNKTDPALLILCYSVLADPPLSRLNDTGTLFFSAAPCEQLASIPCVVTCYPVD